MYSFCQFTTYEKTINEVTDFGANSNSDDSDGSEAMLEDYESRGGGDRPVRRVHKRLGMATVAKFFAVFRSWICLWGLEKHSKRKIGGSGCTVEIDESKFGKNFSGSRGVK